MVTVSDSFLLLHHQAHSLAMILIRACEISLNRVTGLRVCFVFVCVFVCLLYAIFVLVCLFVIRHFVFTGGAIK